MSDSVGELINLLTVGMTHTALYHKGHPRVREAAADLAKLVQTSLEKQGAAQLFVGVVDGRLVCNGEPLIGPTLIARRLIDFIRHLCSGGLFFRRGLAEEELLEFFALGAELNQPLPSPAEARACLLSRGVRQIQLFCASDSEDPPPRSKVANQAWLGTEPYLHLTESAVPVYQALFGTVERAHTQSALGRPLTFADVRSQAEALVRGMKSHPHAFLHLARYNDYDSYTCGHSVRVAILIVLAAMSLGLEERVLVELGTAGLLHDVGKATVSDKILFKRGPLDDDEREEMARHPVQGAYFLIEQAHTSELAVAAAYGHHLRYDRRGYPVVGKWAVVGSFTSLVQVCDVFEALTAVRPYKPSLTPRRALELMLGDRGAFHPGAFRHFVKVMGFYPPGRIVQLSSGELGFVLKAGTRPEAPVVQVFRSEEGAELSPSEQVVVDLSGSEALQRTVQGITEDQTIPVAADLTNFADRSLSLLLRT